MFFCVFLYNPPPKKMDGWVLFWYGQSEFFSDYLDFLSPAHEVGAGDIVITMSGRASARPCFVSGRYL